jgi:hypothetical protein
MRSIRHWTPRYVFDRLREILYHYQYPDYPWLTKSAVEILRDWLRSTDVAVEFGSGRSTLWFAGRVSNLTSIEHNSAWYSRVSKQLSDAGALNVAYCLFDEPECKAKAADSRYAAFTNEIPLNSVDLALIDGIYRGYCARAMVHRIRPGGLLVIDNVNWFVPSKSISPNSRHLSQGPADDDWAEFIKLTTGWRCIWTTNGVTDTALYFRLP